MGLINIKNNAIRLEVVSSRNEENLKTIIEKYVGVGNTIYTDLWAGYNFLSRPYSGFIHNSVNYSHGFFELTSRIEGLWEDIKSIIKKKYIIVFMQIILYTFVSSVSIGELLAEDDLKDIYYDVISHALFSPDSLHSVL